jgi:hypothetical protein
VAGLRLLKWEQPPAFFLEDFFEALNDQFRSRRQQGNLKLEIYGRQEDGPVGDFSREHIPDNLLELLGRKRVARILADREVRLGEKG